MTLPNTEELRLVFVQKFGNPESMGPAPRRRFRFGYYSPADYYETTVSNAINPGCTWIDVGGGHSVFPENTHLARELAQRASWLVALDPSENVQKNDFAHEKTQCLLEDFTTERTFDIATMRMVVEHVVAPDLFVATLSRLIKPGGSAIVFTVNKYSPISIISNIIPFRFHHRIKKMFWGGEEEDTFPVQYRMNTRKQLKALFAQQGFDEVTFAKLDDLSLFSRFTFFNYVELCIWKCFHAVGLTYPENCLLGIYRKK